MKHKLLRAVKIISLVLAVVLAVALLQEFVLSHADHNRQRLKGFYEEEKDTLDVVLLGASEVYSDYAPGYAYERSDITSYIFATQANSILSYKSQLKNILSRQKPSLIVIELNGALYGDEEEVTKEENLHNYSDNVPLDAAKIEWIWNTIGENKAEFLFPIIKFHSLWTDMSEVVKYQRTIINDKLRGYCLLKGMLNETAVFHSDQQSMNSVLAESGDSKAPLTAIEEKGLRDLLQYCRDEGLDNVVFARFPHIVVRRTWDRFERSNTVADIVAEYGYDYLNFEREFTQTGLDEEQDFYNLDHLNIYGQKKFTALLTDRLISDYGLTVSGHDAAVRNEWDECAAYYDAYYEYSDSLIKSGETRELSEDWELIETLKNYLK